MEYKLDRMKPGARYIAQIRSLNDEDTSEWSPGFYITTPTDSTIPANVGTVTGTYVGGGFKYTWPAVTLNTDGSLIRDLDVYEVTITDGTNTYVDTTETLSYYVESSAYSIKLGNGPTVSASVKARDYAGNTSATGSSASVTAPVPSTVTGFTATSAQGGIALKWTAVTNVPILKYEIYAGDTSGFTPDTSGYTNLVTDTTDTSYAWNSGTSVITVKYFKIRAISVYAIPSAAFASASATTLFVDGNRDIGDITTQLGAYSYWPLNETAGTTADDKGTANQDGTYTNGPVLNQTKLLPGSSQCTDFDGTNDYVGIASTQYRNLTSAWTVSALVNLDVTTEQIFATHEYTSGSGIPFLIGTGGTQVGSTAGKFTAAFWNGSWRIVNGTTTYATGTTYMVTGSWDGTNLKIYVNGLLEATATPGSSPTAATTSNIFLGRRWDSNTLNVNGRMSDVSIYNRALSAAEIFAMYDLMQGGGGGGGAITVKEEGTTLTTAATSIDFVGATVTATNSGGAVTVTVAGSGTAAGYTADVGDGTNTSYTITHGLGTRDVVVQIYEKTGTYSQIDCEVRRTTVNAVDLIFATAPTSNQYRVVIAPSGTGLATSNEQTFGYGGTLTTYVGTGRYYAQANCTISSVWASVGTAPTGSSIIVDINKNGTTIFTTQANRPTIAIGAAYSGNVTNMDITSLSAGDYITIDIDQIGSTVAGADLTVCVRMV